MLKSLDPFRFMLITVAGWMNEHQLQVINYLREENRVPREQLGGRLSIWETESAVKCATRV